MKAKVKKPMKHKLGDKHFVDNMECEVKFINAGSAVLFPTFDDPDELYVARHIAYAVMDEYGKIRKI